MVRRSALSATERDSLLAFPESQDDLIQHYSFTESDLSLIGQRHGDANRIGFAIQLCLLRYPGYALAGDMPVPEPVVQWVARQVQSDAAAWPQYGIRDETRREHFQELRAYLTLAAFGLRDYRSLVHSLADLAMQTDKGMVLAGQSLRILRQQRIILPAITVIERACAEAVTRANRRIYRALLEPLQPHHKRGLDNLLNVTPDTNITWLMWLRQSPLKPNSRHMREHIERLKTFQSLALPDGIGRQIHQNRLLKMAREGAQMQPHDLAKFEDERRYATLVALAIEGMATIIDELIDLHDRIMVKVFSTAKNKHQEQFQKQGKAINDKVLLYSKVGQALVTAKESGADPYAAIEAVIPWAAFAQSVTDAAQLAQPATFDHLHLVGDHHSMLRRYTPELLDVLRLTAAPAAQPVLDAINIVRGMNATGSRKVPDDAPVAFIKARWKPLVITGEGIDRRFYEICVLSELKNALRSGDIWVHSSRQFRDFEEYLLPPAKFRDLRLTRALPIAINPDLDQYLLERVLLLNQQLAMVNRLALANELPDAIITDTGLKIRP